MKYILMKWKMKIQGGVEAKTKEVEKNLIIFVRLHWTHGIFKCREPAIVIIDRDFLGFGKLGSPGV